MLKVDDIVKVNGIEGKFQVIDLDEDEAHVESLNEKFIIKSMWVDRDACEKVK